MVIIPIEELKELLTDAVNDAVSKASRKTEAIAPEHTTDAEPLPALITKKQAAAILQVSQATVDNYSTDGYLTKKKIGLRAVRFDRAEVERLARTV